MRGPFVAIVVVTCVAAYACDSFEESTAEPAPDAGGDSAGNVVDAGGDATAPCDDGEPEWAYPGGPVPTRAACGGASDVDLLTSAAHCGRCDHSCGAGGSCKGGLCEAKQEDTILSVPMRVVDGVLYYAHRPIFGIDDVVRLTPGEAPVMLGKFDPDASTDREIVGMAVAGDSVYVRTKQSLRRTSKTDASNAVPALVATLSSEHTSSATLAPDGRLIVAASNEKRYDAVTTTGQVSTFIAGIEFPLEAAFAGDRFVWMSEPFHYPGGAGSSFLRIREGGTDRVLLESAQNMGGLVIDGEQAFVIRNSATGGSILAIDLKDGKQHSLFEGAITNAPFQLVLAVDSTHVYWVKSLDAGGIQSELWKRARCGGAAVRIASRPFMLNPKVIGDRIYFGTNDGLWSIAK